MVAAGKEREQRKNDRLRATRSVPLDLKRNLKVRYGEITCGVKSRPMRKIFTALHALGFRKMKAPVVDNIRNHISQWRPKIVVRRQEQSRLSIPMHVLTTTKKA
jgi:hypothetical protein